MGLEDLQSIHGPFNKKGQPGTGEVKDTFATEGSKKGLPAKMKSKYQTSEKLNSKPTGPAPMGNRPPQKLAGH